MEQNDTLVLESKDRILPIQKALNVHYQGDASNYFKTLHDLLLSFMKPSPTDLESLNIELPEGITYFQMGSDLPSLHFLQFMIRLNGYKNILEIGSFVGVSAMHLADATSAGHVTTVEIGQQFFEIASRNIVNNGYADKVTVVHSDASGLLNIIPVDQTFDLIYLDGDKGNYCNLFKMLLPRLSENGLFIIDDVLFNGDVLNKTPSTEKGLGVKMVLNEVASRDDVEGFLMPLSNGKLLIRRNN